MKTHLTVCGLGKLGSCIAVSFAKAGLQVIGYDLNVETVKAINDGKAPVQEPELQETLTAFRGNISATSDPAEAVAASDACIFITPTPSLSDGSFDNQYLLDGINKIAHAVGDRPFLFIIGSTVTPRSCDELFDPLIKNLCRQGELVYKPELIALGSVMRNLKNPDISVFGARTQKIAMSAFHLYSEMQESDGFEMSFIEAELAKIALNCAITMKISFANQIGMLARKLGADPAPILNFVGSDSRIGQKCLRYGLPYAGPCFPRDNRMLQYVAARADLSAPLSEATDSVNEAMTDDIAEQAFGEDESDEQVGILGAAYKAGTCITEESAGVKLRQFFVSIGRSVKQHDPLNSMEGPHSIEEVLRCPVIIVALDAPQYHNLKIPSGTRLIDPMGVIKNP